MTSTDSGHIDNLNAEQTTLLKTFWKALFAALSSPSTSQAGVVHDSLAETLWLACGLDRPDVLLLRFLRARKFNVDKAVTMTLNALQWREEFGVAELLANGEKDLDAEELQSGKSYFQGVDKLGRPCCYLHVAMHDKNTVDRERTKKLTVLTLETGRMLLQPPQEMATIVFDMSKFSMANMDMDTTRFLLDCMQNYYPESLGHAIVVNAPWVFNGCWVIIKPWIDPVVVAKIRFIKSPEIEEHIDLDQLPEKLGGEAAEYTYIPPSADEEAEHLKFRSDKGANDEAWANFRSAYTAFGAATLAWAQGSDDSPTTPERTKAAAHMREAYVKLSPFIRTRTTYHRSGMVKDPAFPPLTRA
ncbi:hypothetical protein HDU87_004335 [Geranomyces variabilis]|uniref:CRAL-TRIO domain-containing protein n=1 Tax=Geranomyces variabilis TaxID=109894 RepID=A0AAD5XPZ4_9FUNG|nr:hypothetical protein HDU87_004335 [Geranomyces variabilis]